VPGVNGGSLLRAVSRITAAQKLNHLGNGSAHFIGSQNTRARLRNVCCAITALPFYRASCFVRKDITKKVRRDHHIKLGRA
jgi:hypothetical protein